MSQYHEHKFEPRYDYGKPHLINNIHFDSFLLKIVNTLKEFGKDELRVLLEHTQSKVYLGDICVTCGYWLPRAHNRISKGYSY